ncbi:hypothetical protein GCM10023350_46860 [Nocardioides endophyticus]|uniref:DUF1992 domain-containing protein n=1 Tax=Nocardioides endophyticus TaxID=1353775 RepID=A0ABP8ZGP1_9ACTN
MSGYDESHDDGRAAQRAIAAARRHEQQSWLDLQARRAVERGQHGLPPEPGTELDPEWWAAKLAERDRDAVLPPGLALLREEATADASQEDQVTLDVPQGEPAAQSRPRHWWNRR